MRYLVTLPKEVKPDRIASHRSSDHAILRFGSHPVGIHPSPDLRNDQGAIITHMASQRVHQQYQGDKKYSTQYLNYHGLNMEQEITFMTKAAVQIHLSGQQDWETAISAYLFSYLHAKAFDSGRPAVFLDKLSSVLFPFATLLSTVLSNQSNVFDW